MGVLYGQVVQTELALDLAQQGLVRLAQPDPHEVPGLPEDLADVLELDLAQASAPRVGRAGDHSLSRHGRRLRPPSLPAGPGVRREISGRRRLRRGWARPRRARSRRWPLAGPRSAAPGRSPPR